MYAPLVAMIFPAYVLGCIAAIAMSWSYRSLALALSYSYLLIVFQFVATGQAQGWGVNTFLYCSFVQLVMGFCGVFGGNRTLGILSVAAVILNMTAAVVFELSHPIRQIYFIGVNVIQSLQILSLIAMSPAAVRLYRLVKRERRNLPWMRVASGAQ